MSALQRQYFGNPRKRRRSRTISAAPVAHRRRRRSARRTARRSFRRYSSGGMSFNVHSATHALKLGAIGGAGAIAVDAAMAQASKFLPATMIARYNADGSLNLGYYAAKAALALGVGVLGARFGGPLRGFAAAAAQGSYVVMSYEILRTLMPATVPLGYFNPAPAMGIGADTNKVTNLGKYVTMKGMRGMAKYLQGNPAGSMHYGMPRNENRTGEGATF